MPEFSDTSKARLSTCDHRLIILFEQVITFYDCSILCGHRGKEDQEKAYRTGKSKLNFPASKHNVRPSNAVDVVPYPIDWDDIDRFKNFMKLIKLTAKNLKIEIECGGEWTSIIDYPHYQLKED